MFKAFTDNISSLIGSDGNQKNADATESRSDSGPEVAPGRDADSTNSSETSQKEESIGEQSARSDSKVPPPRPVPPLTPASSVCKPDTPPDSPSKTTQDESIPRENSKPESIANEDQEDETKLDKIDEQLGKAAEKAKAWGSYLFSATKMVGESMSAKAKEMKKAVEENTIIGDFMKEQDKFVSENKERARANEAAVPPWVGYNEETQMKEQMLQLSKDKRNFLRNPPAGVQFQFHYETCYPVAMATMAEDENLDKMRFELVPKLVTEHDFWRNYFYRVSLIKQSMQLTSLAKQSGAAQTAGASDTETAQPSADKNSEASKPSVEAAPNADIPAEDSVSAEAVDSQEFVSDAYNLEISDEDLLKEMEALRAEPSAADVDWEKELNKELTDFEVVDGSSDALEKELLDEMDLK